MSTPSKSPQHSRSCSDTPLQTSLPLPTPISHSSVNSPKSFSHTAHQTSHTQPPPSSSSSPPPSPSRTPVLSSFRARQSIFFSWLSTSPFTKSFIEDLEKGVSKTTRSNTLANRRGLRQSYSALQQKKERGQDKLSDETISSSSLSSSTEMSEQRQEQEDERNISFADDVWVYADNQNSQPVKEKVKVGNEEPRSLWAKRRTIKTPLVLNDRAPTSAAGKWLLKTTSSGDLKELK